MRNLSDPSVSGVGPTGHSLRAPRPSIPIKLAHATLIGALLREQPEAIDGCWAHRSEIEDRAKHLHRFLAHVRDYVSVVLADTNEYASGVEHHYLTGQLSDTHKEIVGQVLLAAEHPDGV